MPESTVRLYHRLEDGLGKDMATVLVEHFATKEDLAKLVTKIELREFKAEVREGFAGVEGAIDRLELRMYRTMFAGAMLLVGTNIALWGGTVAILR